MSKKFVGRGGCRHAFRAKSRGCGVIYCDSDDGMERVVKIKCDYIAVEKESMRSPQL